MVLSSQSCSVRQSPRRRRQSVDYDRDVKPILREKCLGCHAGTQPQAGLRLDERRHAMLGSLDGVVIVAGNSARSRLVWRISGKEYGPQMPPTGALQPEQIDVIKRWIDEGVPWPEAPKAARADRRARHTARRGVSHRRPRSDRAGPVGDRTIVNLAGAGRTDTADVRGPVRQRQRSRGSSRAGRRPECAQRRRA